MSRWFPFSRFPFRGDVLYYKQIHKSEYTLVSRGLEVKKGPKNCLRPPGKPRTCHLSGPEMISYTFRHHTPSDTIHLGFPGGAAGAMDGPDALQLAVHAALVVVYYWTYVKVIKSCARGGE